MNGICRGARDVRTATKGATPMRSVKRVADGTKERKEGEKNDKDIRKSVGAELKRP